MESKEIKTFLILKEINDFPKLLTRNWICELPFS